MGLDDWLPLNRLKSAVKKVRFILNFDLNRWRFASIVRRSKQKRLSFNDRSGLRVINDDTSTEEVIDSVSPLKALQRTMSSPLSSDEDIDKRAEKFIANFYKQLRLERQVSLNLQYCRVDSLESTKSDS